MFVNIVTLVKVHFFTMSGSDITPFVLAATGWIFKKS